ncbi:hypothetical protein R1flu_009187 [Riccia fluitans]|uniref:NADH:ubiquinone oxidoreductase intermediate-associated protein 30 domain-containing protein n=1 Tax=Riccia fluitans TaxID=41844 RepID=A0ABD1Z272_9MARC
MTSLGGFPGERSIGSWRAAQRLSAAITASLDFFEFLDLSQFTGTSVNPRQGRCPTSTESMLQRLVHASRQATRRAFAWNIQDLSPPAEQILFRFATLKDIQHWDAYSDAVYGGLSTAALKPSEDNCETGVFTGSLSTELADSAPVRLKRSGFTGMRTIEGRHNLDLEPFDTLVFRVKGDGRVYITSLRTENWVMGPVDAEFNQWQAFLFAPKDEWFTVKIPLNRFLPTWRGKILNAEHGMNFARITGLGISTTVEVSPEGAVRGPGDFRLELEWIKALRSET